jgi:hypothetical protein
LHRLYTTGIAEFKHLANFPQFNRLEEQFSECRSRYVKDFPDDTLSFLDGKSLVSLSNPSTSYSPLEFLRKASQVKSPDEYRTLYNQNYAGGPKTALVKMVSPDNIALFVHPQKLPAALKPYNSQSYADLYKLAVHNGFAPVRDNKPIIPSPEEVDTRGPSVITGRLRALEDLLSPSYHALQIEKTASPRPPRPEVPISPAKLFTDFTLNPFSPGVRVPPFGATENGNLKLMEGCSFLKTEDAGHTVCLSKRGGHGIPETARISRTHYDFIVDAANAPAAAKELTGEIIQKYEQTVLADIDKTRPNTAADYWHNFRVLARKEALNPQDAMAAARRIYAEMPPGEKEKFRKSMAVYEKQRGESYNDRLINYYDRAVKDIPLKNRSPHGAQALASRRHDDDTLSAKGKQIDPSLRLKIGDPVKLNLKIPDLLTGVPQKILKTDLYIASSSEKLNKVVIMSADNTSKYVLPRDTFIKSMERIQKSREKQQRNEEKKEYKKAFKESVGVGW